MIGKRRACQIDKSIHLFLHELTIQQVFIAMTTLFIQLIEASASDLSRKVQLTHTVQHN